MASVAPRARKRGSDDHQQYNASGGEGQGIGAETADAGAVAGADALGDDGHGADAEAEGEGADDHDDGKGEGHGGQRYGSESADEEGVDDVEGHHGKDADEHGGRQPSEGRTDRDRGQLRGG